MKIVSLLPSATEIVYALGLGDDLRGVSFECDYPQQARRCRSSRGRRCPPTARSARRRSTPSVSARVAAGESIYTLDDARIRAIDPDLILAQDLCRVCAVPSGAVEEALDVIGCHAQVVSLDPGRLDEVIACIGTVGAATGTSDVADALMARLRDRVDAVRRRVERSRPAPGARARVAGPALQRRALGARPGGGGRRRARPRGGGCPLAPADLGGDRRPHMSTSPSSCPAGSTWRARWRRPRRSWLALRRRASAVSSPSTPTRTSPARAPGWSRGWSSSSACSTGPPGASVPGAQRPPRLTARCSARAPSSVSDRDSGSVAPGPESAPGSRARQRGGR